MDMAFPSLAAPGPRHTLGSMNLLHTPFARPRLVIVPGLVSESRMKQGTQRPDYWGALVGTGGLIAVVDGLIAAADHPWGSEHVLLPLVGGVRALGAAH